MVMRHFAGAFVFAFVNPFAKFAKINASQKFLLIQYFPKLNVGLIYLKVNDFFGPYDLRNYLNMWFIIVGHFSNSDPCITFLTLDSNPVQDVIWQNMKYLPLAPQ